MKVTRTGAAIPREHLSTMAYVWQQYENAPRHFAFRAKTRDEWVVWRDALRTKLLECLGGFPAERCDLNAQTMEVVDSKTYRREKVFFYSEPGVAIPCYVLTPRTVELPYRPVIALHGHGSGGARLLLGQVRGKKERAQLKAYNYDYARQLVERGFMVFVPVQRALGERVEADHAYRTMAGLDAKSCEMTAAVSLLLGRTLIGMRVWDVLRTIDYVQSRSETKVEGIGCVGLSGGGSVTCYAAALDERLSAVAIEGAFCSYRASIMSIPHCLDNYVPGILRYGEMADIAGLIAPRPLLIEHGVRDPIFPIEGTRQAYGELEKVYTLLDSADQLDADFFPGAHRFGGRKVFEWLDRWLV